MSYYKTIRSTFLVDLYFNYNCTSCATGKISCSSKRMNFMTQRKPFLKKILHRLHVACSQSQHHALAGN